MMENNTTKTVLLLEAEKEAYVLNSMCYARSEKFPDLRDIKSQLNMFYTIWDSYPLKRSFLESLLFWRELLAFSLAFKSKKTKKILERGKPIPHGYTVIQWKTGKPLPSTEMKGLKGGAGCPVYMDGV